MKYLKVTSHIDFSERGIINMPQVTIPHKNANNLQTLLSIHLLAYISALAH